MLKRKKAKKIQKPIDYDIHLKYRCQNCNQDHWLSYLESSTKNFKVVCDCGVVFKVKRTIAFHLKYEKDTEQKQKIIIATEETHKVSEHSSDIKEIGKNDISESILQSGTSILSSFGYSKIESYNMIKESYSKLGTDNIGDLVRFALANCK